MKGLLVYLTIIAISVITAGCTGVEEEVVKLKADPTNLLPIYAQLSFGIFLLLLFFTGRGIWRSLLDTVQYVGLLSLVASPFYFILTRDVGASVAIAFSGIMGIVTIKFLFLNGRGE